MNNKEFYKKIVDTYGKQQVVIAIEELSELQKELCKALRCKTNFDNIAEEIADVEIMLEQMKIYFGINGEEIEGMKKLKIKRTTQRLGIKDE